MSRGVTSAMFLAACLATCPSGDEVEGVFLLADRTKHCEPSCKGCYTVQWFKNPLQRYRNCCEKLNLVLLRSTLAATKMLRDLMIAGYVTPCNLSCNLCRNKFSMFLSCESLKRTLLCNQQGKDIDLKVDPDPFHTKNCVI